RQATRPAIVRSTPEPAKPKLGKPQKTATAVKKTPTKSRPVPAIEPPALFSEKFRWPVEGRVVSPFGPKSNGLHNDGINIKASRGTPVEAAENGVVAYAGNELRGFGNLLLIRHSDSWMSAYAHLEKVDVTRGTVIKRGQIVGKVGSSGSVGEPQLHFEIRKGSRAINPLKYLAKRGAGG
ncbi:MAG: peptidoglycan DD-metalloendopeptidase family protein, partial [Pseudomonadota bacterium]|nr:peptidoglycan DD-metalloendopeptidase family protein [Pseudomonadota bacterium]